MFPGTVAATFVLLALVPGWLYLRLVSRIRAPSSQSSLHETLEVLAVGVATTGVSALGVVLTPHHMLPFTLDIEVWSAQGTEYLKRHPTEAAWTLVMILGLALLIAVGLYGLQALFKPAEFSSSESVWIRAIGVRPKEMIPYVGVHVRDGRLIEGVLFAYALGESDRRDIALKRPIRISAPNGSTPVKLPNLDRLVIPDSEISFIAVAHLPQATGTKAGRFRIGKRGDVSGGANG